MPPPISILTSNVEGFANATVPLLFFSLEPCLKVVQIPSDHKKTMQDLRMLLDNRWFLTEAGINKFKYTVFQSAVHFYSAYHQLFMS